MSVCNKCGVRTCDGKLVHLQDGHTYPINILGYAATALDAQPIVKKIDTDGNIVCFQIGDDSREDGKNIFKKEITFVEMANKAISDEFGHNIAETYATKDDLESFKPVIITISSEGQNVNYSWESIYSDMYIVNPHSFTFYLHTDSPTFIESNETAEIVEGEQMSERSESKLHLKLFR